MVRATRRIPHFHVLAGEADEGAGEIEIRLIAQRQRAATCPRYVRSGCTGAGECAEDFGCSVGKRDAFACRIAKHVVEIGHVAGGGICSRSKLDGAGHLAEYAWAGVDEGLVNEDGGVGGDECAGVGDGGGGELVAEGGEGVLNE